jgi:outer membrane beta-barrel protein
MYFTPPSIRSFVFSLICICLSLIAMPLQAQDGIIPKVAVQNRKFNQGLEWTVFAGTLPLDAFKKGITAGGALTMHLNETWAWEAINYQYSFEWKTALEDELRVFELRATPFERVNHFATSNLVFKPLYWKGSWLNQSLVFGELFFVAGGGYGWLTQTNRPVVDFGFGVKLFHTNSIQTRLDVRALSFINQDDFHNELWIGLGLSL